MNGSDHLLPQPGIGHVVAAANAAPDGYHFAISSLDEYVRAQPVEGLVEWHGELRSGARANVLMGVASNRIDVHQEAASAERAVERAPPRASRPAPGTASPRWWWVRRSGGCWR
jgi:hypothetical protein